MPDYPEFDPARYLCDHPDNRPIPWWAAIGGLIALAGAILIATVAFLFVLDQVF